jgi:pantothenate kinase
MTKPTTSPVPTSIRDTALGEILARYVPGQRMLVAIAAAPASGKSTIAAALSDELCARGYGARVVPMDGFHLDNPILHTRGLLARKGSPESFDAAGFVALIKRLRSEDEVVFPVFDRAEDRSIAGADCVIESDQIVLVEGNYLLLDQAPWSDLAPLWDFTLWLEVPFSTLEARLIARWITHGLTETAARDRAMGNDLPNAQRIIGHSRRADFVVNGG